MKRLLILLLASAIMLSGCSQVEDKKVKVVTMSPRDMVEQLKLGEIDAFVAWEPFVSEAVVKGYGKIIATSADIWPNHPCCVVATAEKDDRAVVTAIVWAHVKATRFINDPENREKVLQYAMEFTGKSKEVVEEALTRIKFIEYPDEGEFVKYYENLKKGGYLKKDVGELGYKSEDEFLRDFLYRDVYDYVVSKLAENESWIPEKVNRSVRMGYLTADLHQLAFYVAMKEGYYDQVGLKVEAKEFANGVVEMEGFKNGEIDAGYLGGAPATLKRVNDDVRISIIAGANSEGSAIVARSASSIEELAGKKVAIPGFGTVQDFLLRMAAEKAGLEITT
ncbi:MAG: Nitrate ABC transporter, ATP-binding protein, putative [Archaeoglobus fulgidus]|uniref:Nitrate ABC transporter, ATP-binding protein, putative n=1 Tax=Archaeoglobus fulgidus TaxID=2234 RepID=A0A117KUR9_ARCFL|nr:ABC transporter substrate-binding protein [Archaeoglobus fulgidus]KUJ93450.1 MAG: Nitrate ABC transporter, ATP-binding protein, putative [Archaeoglobus fulgidus]KUK07073.1 MAG: Nitrate ABC transporter, ATP-binding protein, putative [Archaeoglobus fulgidus]